MTVFFDTEREQQLLARIRELEEMILRHTDLCPFGGGADGKRNACAFGHPGCACADWYNEHGWASELSAAPEPEPVHDPPPADAPDAEPAAGDEVPFEQEGGELHKATQSELAEWFEPKDKPSEEAAKAAIYGGNPK